MPIRKNVKVDDPWDPKLLEQSDFKFDYFMGAVRERYGWGQRMHGDRTAEYTLFELLCEAQEEILDAPVWLSFLYSRLEELKSKVLRITDEYEKLEQDSKTDGQGGSYEPGDEEDGGRAGCPVSGTEGADVPSGGPGPESCVGFGRKEEESPSKNPDVSWDHVLRGLAEATLPPIGTGRVDLAKMIWDMAGKAIEKRDE